MDAYAYDSQAELVLRSEDEYAAAMRMWDALVPIAATVPMWLHDRSGIADVIDVLDEATSAWERAHNPPPETNGGGDSPTYRADMRGSGRGAMLR